ncbi:MAG: Holliday junction resolvase RuvX [Pseudohongiellaceae bacterium]
MSLATLATSPPESQQPVSALGFDFGTQRIGVAFGQTLTGTAQALCVIKANDGVPDWERIAALITEWQPNCLVVGLPYNMDGSDSELLTRATRFGNRLQNRFKLPVYGVDERLSSQAAIEQIAQSEQHSGKRKAIDDVAAQIILETWFQELGRKS